MSEKRPSCWPYIPNAPHRQTDSWSVVLEHLSACAHPDPSMCLLGEPGSGAVCRASLIWHMVQMNVFVSQMTRLNLHRELMCIRIPSHCCSVPSLLSVPLEGRGLDLPIPWPIWLFCSIFPERICFCSNGPTPYHPFPCLCKGRI